MSAGVNTFTSIVPMSGAPRGLNFAYLVGGYKILGTKYFRLDSRLTNIGIQGLGHKQFDVAHRATAFFREEILQKGNLGFKNSSTIYYNYTIGNQKFSKGLILGPEKYFMRER